MQLGYRALANVSNHVRIYIVYLSAQITKDPPVAEPEPHRSLRKLVIRGPYCQETVLPHSFPRLLSLSINLYTPHQELPTFLMRASHLEMLVVRELDFHRIASLKDTSLRLPSEMRVAIPSLRVLHLQNRYLQRPSALIVTPRFHTPIALHLPDAPFDPQEPLSQAEIQAEELAVYDEAALVNIIQKRMDDNPLFDPYGIERARIEIQGRYFDAEAELDYLKHVH
ncbi:hypothetical protein R3P38DRAFT_1226391 [Favolaschia claudopus]|uniref:Uncharacterized protein n=1 Tax=Favolaschia claudopus TaxID=2862362 RepID=A0AAW0B286_9AGAR